MPTSAGIRETIESIAIAFVLAFLFRTFEAEAFVIPTGSMAPTLMGRHKDVICPEVRLPLSGQRQRGGGPGREALDGPRVSDGRRHVPDVSLHGRPCIAKTIRRTTATAFWWANSPTSSPSRSGGT